MKFALAFAVSLQLSAQPRDSWFGPDKVQHFFMTAFIQSAAYGGLRVTSLDHSASLAGATVTSAVFSVGKEMRDKRTQNLFSAKDLVWDAAGAGAATLMLQHTRR